jgi:hypothetical protein
LWKDFLFRFAHAQILRRRKAAAGAGLQLLHSTLILKKMASVDRENLRLCSHVRDARK